VQGWRLFAEAHKVQAGDQVAFELVSENRLVAQVIKHADANQAPRPVSQKRKFVPGPRAPNSVFQRPVSSSPLRLKYIIPPISGPLIRVGAFQVTSLVGDGL
jgi:hypothetical protein